MNYLKRLIVLVMCCLVLIKVSVAEDPKFYKAIDYIQKADSVMTYLDYEEGEAVETYKEYAFKGSKKYIVYVGSDEEDFTHGYQEILSDIYMILEDDYFLIFKKEFKKGDEWVDRDNCKTKVVDTGLTVKIKKKIYQDCIKVKITTPKEFLDEEKDLIEYEILAPKVGLIQRFDEKKELICEMVKLEPFTQVMQDDYKKKSVRRKTNANIRNFVFDVQISSQLIEEKKFTAPWIDKEGIKTLTTKSKEHVIRHNKKLKVNFYDPLGRFVDLNGAHPFGGYYVFFGIDEQGQPKSKNDPDTRLVMEVYDWESKGDGLVAIGFGDLSIKTFPVPKKNINDDDIKKILSVKGKKSLFGE